MTQIRHALPEHLAHLLTSLLINLNQCNWSRDPLIIVVPHYKKNQIFLKEVKRKYATEFCNSDFVREY